MLVPDMTWMWHASCSSGTTTKMWRSLMNRLSAQLFTSNFSTPKLNYCMFNLNALGFLPQSTTLHQETTISVSAPVFSDVSESPSTTSQTSDELKRNSKRSRHGRGGRQAIMSPVSVRRSPRFKVTWFWLHRKFNVFYHLQIPTG